MEVGVSPKKFLFLGTRGNRCQKHRDEEDGYASQDFDVHSLSFSGVRLESKSPVGKFRKTGLPTGHRLVSRGVKSSHSIR